MTQKGLKKNFTSIFITSISSIRLLSFISVCVYYVTTRTVINDNLQYLGILKLQIAKNATNVRSILFGLSCDVCIFDIIHFFLIFAHSRCRHYLMLLQSPSSFRNCTTHSHDGKHFLFYFRLDYT